MKPRNKAVNVITAILAALLSILLVVVLFATGLVGAARTAVTPRAMEKMIVKVIHGINFEQLVIDNAGENGYTEEDLAQAQIMSKLFDSDAAKEFFRLYTQDLAAALAGTYTAETAVANGQTLRDLAHTHIDDMVDIIGALDTEADRENIRQELLKFVDENADDLLGSLSVETIVQDNGLSDMQEIINVLPTVLWVLIGVCVLLAGLIYACRYYRFGGFIWIGVNAGIAAVLMLGVTVIIKSGILLTAINAMEASDLLTGVFSAVSGVFTSVTLILLGVAVLFIGLFILLKYTALNKWDAPAQDIPDTVEETDTVPQSI